MKRIMVAALLAVLVVPLRLAAGQAPPAAQEPVSRVAGLEDARRAAMVAGDVKALERLIDERATYVHSNGLIQSRDELFSMLSRGDIRYVSFAVEAVQYRAYGSTVVGTGVQIVRLASGGNPFTSRSRFTVVYVDEDGEPRMAAYQSTALPEVVREERR
jgi:hypothetical protein